MSNLIEPRELHSQLGDPLLRIVDVRFDLSDTEAGERAYRTAHIPGALYLHLDRDLSGPVGEHGGRHPLPDPDRLAQRMGQLGIGDEHQVVAYDAGNSMVASRLWWLLRYLGHEHVRVLDGGLAAWQAAGFELDEEDPYYPPARFTPRPNPELVVDREHVMRRLGDPQTVLVDARAPERYRGESEPIDPLAGHIPSAVNLPFAENLAGGHFRSASELRERFEFLADSDEVVVYCGSGVSAAHDLLAMEEAGMGGARLYHGSWSDWCSYPDAPVATGEEP